MDNRADGGAVAVVIGLVLILLLLGLGGGVYFFWSRQQLAMQAQRALAAEAEARMQLERARADADAAAAAKTSRDKESAAPGEGSIENAVRSVLTTQQDAWNRGDIDAFMEHYWKDEALTFSSEGKTTRGWEATLTRYKERPPRTH